MEKTGALWRVTEEGRAVYERAIRARMLAIEPSGRFPEVVETVAIIARRPR
jgi:hypothetical protein